MKTRRFLISIALSAVSFQAFAQEINLSGFASAHVTQHLAGNSDPEYYSPKTDYQSFSKFGLNISSAISSKFTVQSQILTSGRHTLAGADTAQWDVYANWLFLAYRPVDNFRVRIGRQLFPAWMVSEYIDVGYMYPWTETPHSVYELAPFKSLNGVSADYSFNLSNGGRLVVTGFGGEEKIKIPIAQGGNEDNSYGSVIGSELAYTQGGHKLRLMGSYYKVETEAVDASGTNTGSFSNTDVKTLTTGYRYDAGRLLIYGEWGLREGVNGTEVSTTQNPRGKEGTYGKLAQAGYITAGYWFDNILPHLTLSNTKWDTGTIEGTQDLYSLGLNVKIQEGIMFKTNIGYSVSRQGPAHMSEQGDATTAITGFDVIF